MKNAPVNSYKFILIVLSLLSSTFGFSSNTPPPPPTPFPPGLPINQGELFLVVMAIGIALYFFSKRSNKTA